MTGNETADGSTTLSEAEKARTDALPDGSASDASDTQRGEDTASGGGAQEGEHEGTGSHGVGAHDDSEPDDADNPDELEQPDTEVPVDNPSGG